jgi:hypothetical protein
MSTITGHFARVHVTWSGPNLAISDCTGFDQRASQIVNGDEGGCWAPLTPIEFSGSTYGLFLTGPLTIWGPNGYLQTTGTSRFNCNLGTFPQLGLTHSGRSRNLKSTFITARAIPWAQWLPHTTSAGTLNGKMQTVAPTTQVTGGSAVPTTIFAPIEVHNGGTLSSVTLTFEVATQDTSIPTLPKARVLQVDVNGNETPMTSVAAGGDVNGYVSFPTPASLSAYQNGGQVNSWTIPCDTVNVVDTSQYHYVVQIVEEQNGTVTPVLADVDLVSNNEIVTAFDGVQTLDGVATTPGMRVLLKDQIDPAQNGVYFLPPVPTGTAGTIGIWQRSSDLAAGSTVAVGMQVPSKAIGSGLGGTTFVLSSPQASPVVGGGPTTWAASAAYTTGQTVVPSYPNGLIYTCTTAGNTASSEPLWPNQVGAKTSADGSVVWTCSSSDTRGQLYFSPIGNPTGTAPPPWQPSAAYVYGQVISPTTPNGFVYRAGTSSWTSGSTEPTWSTVPGQVTTDNGGSWIAMVDTYNEFVPTTLRGNVWNDLTVAMTNIKSLAFQ